MQTTTVEPWLYFCRAVQKCHLIRKMMIMGAMVSPVTLKDTTKKLWWNNHILPLHLCALAILQEQK